MRLASDPLARSPHPSLMLEAPTWPSRNGRSDSSVGPVSGKANMSRGVH